jgi:hypothetical protein
MKTLMKRYETLGLNMSINLRGADVRMTKQQLNGPQISPAFQQVSSKGVSERMWGNTSFYPSPLRVFFYQFPYALTTQSLAGTIQKNAIL